MTRWYAWIFSFIWASRNLTCSCASCCKFSLYWAPAFKSSCSLILIASRALWLSMPLADSQSFLQLLSLGRVDSFSLSFGMSQHLTMAELGRCFHKACHRSIMWMDMQILLDKIHLRIIHLHIVMENVVNVRLVQLASRRPTLPSGLGDVTTVVETNMRRHNCVTHWW